MVATMHRLAAAMLLLLCCCCLFLATHAHPQPHPQQQQQQLQPAAGGNRASPSCIPHERDALLAFKHGVTSDPAGLLDSWRRDGGHGEQDCCRWRGVRCSNRTGHVHELRLGGNYPDYLVGQISQSLLALEHLEHLDLSRNELEGPTARLPEFLGSLKGLKYLNLSGIPFCGRVPPQLGNLSNLQYLDLSNYMHSTNSTDISWLTRLRSIQYLDLGGVDLSTIADWPHVMNMLPSLRVLHLSYCSLASANQSVPHLNLTNLEELDASRNSFDHPLVTSWFWNITSLKYLYLYGTGMYGRFPDALGNMASLQVLDLSDHYSDGVDDDEKNMRVMTADLKNLCNLEVLKLEHSLLLGDITELFRNLPRCSPNKLQELDLSDNQLTGKLPRWIGQLTSLVTLNLGSNNIAGPVPASVGQFAALRTLDLSRNNLSGNVPHEIGKLSNLAHLYLSGNKLDGVIMEEIVLLDGLLNLDLSRNHLSGVIPNMIGKMRPLQSLDLSRNELSGEIPATLSCLTFLRHLDLSYNHLTGRIPSGTQLDTLYDEYPSMYTGNTGLCGHPLPNICSNKGDTPKEGGLGTTDEVNGIRFFYLGLGCGFVVGTWMAFGVLLFKRSWRIACFRLSDKLCDKVYVLVAIWARKIRN